jgi:hypothetical protein
MELTEMKIAFAIAAFACCVSTSFAQTAPAATSASPASPAVTAPNGAGATSSTAQAGGWVPPYGQPVAQKTRAQVYQELVEAEKDGQLDYLNSTVYAH